MDIFKLYFDSEAECMAYSAAKAEFEGCNMTSTVYWYAWEEDENGWYCEIDTLDNSGIEHEETI